MKSPEHEANLNALLESTLGTRRDGSCCVTCRSTAIQPRDFCDDLSRREFAISFMCQKCQDEAFAQIDEEVEKGEP